MSIPAVDVSDASVVVYGDASEVLADAVAWTVLVCRAKLLDASDLFVVGVAKVSFGAGAHRTVVGWNADGVATARHRSVTNTLKKILSFIFFHCFVFSRTTYVLDGGWRIRPL